MNLPAAPTCNYGWDILSVSASFYFETAAFLLTVRIRNVKRAYWW
jgi:hypothetical protein